MALSGRVLGGPTHSRASWFPAYTTAVSWRSSGWELMDKEVREDRIVPSALVSCPPASVPCQVAGVGFEAMCFYFLQNPLMQVVPAGGRFPPTQRPRLLPSAAPHPPGPRRPQCPPHLDPELHLSRPSSHSLPGSGLPEMCSQPRSSFPPHLMLSEKTSQVKSWLFHPQGDGVGGKGDPRSWTPFLLCPGLAQFSTGSPSRPGDIRRLGGPPLRSSMTETTTSTGRVWGPAAFPEGEAGSWEQVHKPTPTASAPRLRKIQSRVTHSLPKLRGETGCAECGIRAEGA